MEDQHEKNKFNLIVLFSIALSLLAGCGDVYTGVNTANDEEQAKVSSSQEGVIEPQEEFTHQEEPSEEQYRDCEVLGKYVYSGVDGKLRRKMLMEFRTVRELKYHDLSNMQSFYCLDNVDIPGYKLSFVEMYSTRFTYSYSPRKGDDLGFIIIFHFPSNGQSFNLTHDNYTKNEDGFAYRKDGGALRGLIGGEGVVFSIITPKQQSFPPEIIEQWYEMRDIMSEEDFQEGLDIIAAEQEKTFKEHTKEFLRDLAFRIIESAELVTVEQVR